MYQDHTTKYKRLGFTRAYAPYIKALLLALILALAVIIGLQWQSYLQSFYKTQSQVLHAYTFKPLSDVPMYQLTCK